MAIGSGPQLEHVQHRSFGLITNGHATSLDRIDVDSEALWSASVRILVDTSDDDQADLLTTPEKVRHNGPENEPTD